MAEGDSIVDQVMAAGTDVWYPMAASESQAIPIEIQLQMAMLMAQLLDRDQFMTYIFLAADAAMPGRQRRSEARLVSLAIVADKISEFMVMELVSKAA